MQLNPFEIKAEISRIMSVLDGVSDFSGYEAHYHTLDMQEDKNVIVKILFREVNHPEYHGLIKFLLLRYSEKQELVEHLWSIIKNNLSSNYAKIFALDLLREIDTNWTYEEIGKYVENSDELVESDTKKILDTAIVSPEVQIDFLDFLSSLPESDKITLLKSLADDYSDDELANIVIPVFLSKQSSEVEKVALNILGNSKSQLAFHALSAALNSAKESIKPLINKNLSMLKLSGIRDGNSKEFYKKVLSNSKPYKFCITYPDGQGNQAVIFSREKNNNRVQFVAVVINDYKGIRDCFGFNDISKFECNTIIDRFYRGQSVIELPPDVLKSILEAAEQISVETIPYEYVCWKTILSDIDCADLTLEYSCEKLSDNELEDIFKSDYTDYWFLNSDYSDEFEDFLALANQTEPKNFDEIIDENIEKIFFESEYNVWRERVLHVAILKHFYGDIENAKKIYSLYNDKKSFRELLKNIVRKSLYEYYYYKKDKDRIDKIEEMWVN